jgi:MOSC domain-containing protein YiiM
MRGLILQVNLSIGGLPKRPVGEAFLTPLGFEGDAVAHPGLHGGPDRAVLLAAAEAVDELAARGYPLFYGAMGENLTTRGLDRAELRPGLRLRAGQAVIELTRLRTPCASLDVYGPGLKREIFRQDARPGEPVWGMAGFYASVVRPGWVRTGDIICVVDTAV